MNSVYKRYILIIFTAIVILAAVIMNNTNKLMKQVDRVNAYVSENGTLYMDSVDTNKYSYIYFYTDETEEIAYPNFERVKYKAYDNDIDDLMIVVLALVIAMLYVYERGATTADFCAVLPIKKRSMFTAKAIGIVLIILCVAGLNLWAIHSFNIRVSACNSTLAALGEETITPIEGYQWQILNSMLGFMNLGACYLLLAEFTGRAYLPPCIFILAMFAFVGTLSGISNFMHDYAIDLGDGVIKQIILFVRSRRYGGINYRNGSIVNFVIAMAIMLWGLFLSGRGDLSRKGNVFRFKWVEKCAVICIVISAAFCSYALISGLELSYHLSMNMAIMIMLFTGVFAYFAAKRIILRFER